MPKLLPPTKTWKRHKAAIASTLKRESVRMQIGNVAGHLTIDGNGNPSIDRGNGSQVSFTWDRIPMPDYAKLAAKAIQAEQAKNKQARMWLGVAVYTYDVGNKPMAKAAREQALKLDAKLGDTFSLLLPFL